MVITVSEREVGIIMASLNGTKFSDYTTEKEKEVLLSRLIDEKRKIDESRRMVN